MTDLLRSIINRFAPGQQRPVDPAQRRNDAGGYTFPVDDWSRLRRFLVLGADGGTYYTSARELTRDNAEIVLRLAAQDGTRVVEELLALSLAGRAPRQQPTLFALAAVSALGDDDARRRALDVLPQVARTGTHLFLFAGYAEQLRGWGRGLRRGVARWYTSKDADQLAYQVAKYRQREGWAHRDLLRLAHPVPVDAAQREVLDWVCGRPSDHPYLAAVDAAHADGADVASMVRSAGLSWEMLPSQALGERAVWEALLDAGVPQTALMRQLPRLTRLGLFTGPGSRTTQVVEQLTDPERLRRARVHPVNVLVAQRTYASGRSARGESRWEPVTAVVDALDAAFYASFGAVEPAGRRTLLALDVSGSMSSPVSGLPLSCREASAALALVQIATEPGTTVVGFAGGNGMRWDGQSALTPLAISPRQRLDDVLRTVDRLPFGPTDCALPMLYAQDRGLEVDTFVVYTDNETWFGDVHPHQALAGYRQTSGIDARLVVVAMTATGFSIADPGDAGMLDVAGFDAAVPGLISAFSRGDV